MNWLVIFSLLGLSGVNALPTTPPTTTILTTTAECQWQDNKVEQCRVYTCENGRWLGFEFTATKTCCYTRPDHPKCIMFFPELFETTTPPTTTFPTTTTECTNSGKVENCMSYWCSNGRYQPFEFTATHSCCQTKPFHPRCIMMFPELSGTARP
ncbi:hypothetical protein LOTGIDRAFT_153038 [Lottia gigantea]|uniref:Uncharacterized protein n=1 Tax=Lottia gigantea TaxID=225164 RepID=V4ALE4_LOTGI|nr:hypothetical protein LOTGIDRAFT_153038 [Lottia gigantea]ESO97927.1 hypothetical protein LOTGIDRAFT_153038 [Lottia gigantea]